MKTIIIFILICSFSLFGQNRKRKRVKKVQENVVSESLNNEVLEKPKEKKKSYFFKLRTFNFHSHQLKTNFLNLETIDSNINDTMLSNYIAYPFFNTLNSSQSPNSHFSFDYYWTISDDLFQNFILGYTKSYQNSNFNSFSYKNASYLQNAPKKYGSAIGKLQIYNTDLYAAFKIKYKKYNITPKIISRRHQNAINYFKYSSIVGEKITGNQIDNKKTIASANLIYTGIRVENNLKEELKDWSLIAEYSFSSFSRGTFETYHSSLETINYNSSQNKNTTSIEIEKGIYKVKGENITLGLKYKFNRYTNIYFERYNELYYHSYIQTSGAKISNQNEQGVISNSVSKGLEEYMSDSLIYKELTKTQLISYRFGISFDF